MSTNCVLMLKDDRGGNLEVFELSEGSKTVGRGTGCDFVIDDEMVSAEHVRIIGEKGKYLVHDLASRNGTFVNQERVLRQYLNDGDEIGLGRARLRFVVLRGSEASAGDD